MHSSSQWQGREWDNVNIYEQLLTVPKSRVGFTLVREKNYTVVTVLPTLTSIHLERRLTWMELYTRWLIVGVPSVVVITLISFALLGGR